MFFISGEQERQGVYIQFGQIGLAIGDNDQPFFNRLIQKPFYIRDRNGNLLIPV